MTPSDWFLARRGQAWPLGGAAWPFVRSRSASRFRSKVSTRYMPGRMSALNRERVGTLVMDVTERRSPRKRVSVGEEPAAGAVVG